MSQITRIIQAAVAGEAKAGEDLFLLVYDDLKKMACRRMTEERAGHTLQPTALVHEAYLRLVGPNRDSWANRAHFFAAAAESMRRILIEHARGRNRQKRGGGRQRVELGDVADPAGRRDDELLALDEAIDNLELLDAPKARLVKLKFFGGLTTREAAEMLGLSTRTAERYWAYARAWLFRFVQENE